MGTRLLGILALVVVVAASTAYVSYDNGFERGVKRQQQEQTADIGRVSGEADPPSNVNENETTNVPFAKTDAHGYYGMLTLKGHLDIQTRTCNPGDPCGDTVEYASFVLLEAPTILKEFASTQPGTTFIAQDRIGLGCFQSEENMIYYENFGDTDSITARITGQDMTKLRTSSKDNPVELKLTKPIYNGFRTEPDCYSLFRYFKVL